MALNSSPRETGKMSEPALAMKKNKAKKKMAALVSILMTGQQRSEWTPDEGPGSK